MAPLPLQKNPDVGPKRGGGICRFLNLQEDNVRFILLAILLFVYLAFGAFVFQAVEEIEEKKLRGKFQHLYDEFVQNFSQCYINLSPDYVEEHKFHFPPIEELANSSDSFVSSVTVRSESLEKVGEPFRITLEGLHDLLYSYGNATQTGILWKRPRWDWVGSFHFAWTIVSTIGYGATTPSTMVGKLLIIPYGFIGCACGLLFFNLFLERIITFLATCMRKYRLRRQKRRPCIIDNRLATDDKRPDVRSASASAAAAAVTISVAAARQRQGNSPSRSSTGGESVIEEQPDWKPSVYWVMLCLFVMSVCVIGVSGVLWTSMEGWSYGESVYFSFVSYATIGLGDYVSLQQPFYGPLETLYRLLAFTLMVFGCCCIYSLLNVTSIVIKQFLNYVIKKMDVCDQCCCCVYCNCSANRIRRRMSSRRRRSTKRANANKSFRGKSFRKNGNFGPNQERIQISVLNSLHPQGHSSPDFNSEAYGDGDGDGDNDGDMDERRCSGENMISIRGELSNKVSLAVMQKRLYETAQMSRHSYNNEGSYGHGHGHGHGHGSSRGNSFSATSVGPLAIVTEKLGDNPA